MPSDDTPTPYVFNLLVSAKMMLDPLLKTERLKHLRPYFRSSGFRMFYDI